MRRRRKRQCYACYGMLEPGEVHPECEAALEAMRRAHQEDGPRDEAREREERLERLRRRGAGAREAGRF